MSSPFLTPQEVANIMRVTRQTVYKWISSGMLPAYRVSKRSMRIKREDLEELLRQSRPQES